VDHGVSCCRQVAEELLDFIGSRLRGGQAVDERIIATESAEVHHKRTPTPQYRRVSLFWHLNNLAS
jgi:hypothetical protein